MSFAPTITHPSKAQPGVSFEVRRMGFGRRTDLDFTTLAYRQRLRELESDYPQPSERETELRAQLAIAERKALAVPADQFDAVIATEAKPLAAELDAAVPADTRKRRAVIDEEYSQVDARIRAEWIRSGLISIMGGELDGMTAEQLLDYGPTAVAQEIYTALTGDGKLGGKERPNLRSPTTSGDPVAGENPSITVPSAVAPPEAGTSIETASATSLAT